MTVVYEKPTILITQDGISGNRANAFIDEMNAGVAATAADRVQTGLDRAVTAADRVQTGLDRSAAAASAAQAALYDGPKVDTFAELASVTPSMLDVGEYIRVVSTGAVYQRVSSGWHLDYSGAGGVKLYVLPSDAGYNVKAFGATGDGATNDRTAIVAAQNAAAAAGGATVYFPAGEYKITASIPMLPGITYQGPMRAELTAHNPGRARLFSAASDIFTNSAALITGTCFRDLFIQSEPGGGHIFNWATAGIVAKIEIDGCCLVQQNTAKSVIHGPMGGGASDGIFSIWMHDFEFSYAPACSLSPINIQAFTVNSICIERFWSTANGTESAAGNPAIRIESTNASGAAFNITIREGVFELPGSGSVLFRSVSESTIEDCSVYDLTIAPGYFQFSVEKGATGPASSNIAIRRCRSTVGTATWADVYVDAAVASQGAVIVEQCTLSYLNGASSANGSQVALLNSSITNKANLPYLEFGGPVDQIKFGATAGTSANVSLWNGYPGNRDGALNIAVGGAHSGSISKTGVFSWGAAYITQSGGINAGVHVYPGTPTGAVQVNAGLLAGAGVPGAGTGNDGDFYFRGDGGAGTSIYMRRAGAWVGIV